MVSVSTDNLRDFLGRLPSLLVGLFLFAVGVVANLNSGLGMSPWGVLNVGVSNITPLTLGQASQVIGLVVIAIGWALGFAPGFGTLMNMYFIGLFIDLIIAWELIPTPTDP
ncbi:membrane protein, partial [Candidatus Bathyarchaeota archaeon]|nr:membrane protein [Candidatus Bathyarchaeota archaeon]